MPAPTGGTPNYKLQAPEETDLLRDLPRLSRDQMTKLDTHSHPNVTTAISDMDRRMLDLNAKLDNLLGRHGVVINTVEVTQEENVGFDILIQDPDFPDDDKKKKKLSPLKTLAIPRTEARSFIFYYQAKKKFQLVTLEVTAEEKKPISLVPGGTFSITYVTDLG